MVFDKQRLPRVQPRRKDFAQLHIAAGEEAPGDARHLGMKPKHIPSARPERGLAMRDTWT